MWGSTTVIFCIHIYIYYIHDFAWMTDLSWSFCGDFTLPKTSSLPRKNGAWETILTSWGVSPYFQGCLLLVLGSGGSLSVEREHNLKSTLGMVRWRKILDFRTHNFEPSPSAGHTGIPRNPSSPWKDLRTLGSYRLIKHKRFFFGWNIETCESSWQQGFTKTLVKRPKPIHVSVAPSILKKE